MLEKLALKHSLWLKMAKSICKDAYLADDLVSEMYLKVSDYNKELNDYYIYFTIKHLFIIWLREEKNRQTDDVFYCLDERNVGTERLASKSKQVKSKTYLDYCEDGNLDYIENNELELPNCITWVEKQILLLKQNNSSYEIAKRYHIHYKKVQRIEQEAKQKIKLWQKEQRNPFKELAT
jgi:hypothetical protein